MIRDIRIQNFKSIADLTLQPGRVTVLIGANGSGKSNILEAIAFAAAASQDKLDNEFLVTRGIRVTDPQFMFSAFDDQAANRTVEIEITHDNLPSFTYRLFTSDKTSFPIWKQYDVVDQNMINAFLDTEGIGKLKTFQNLDQDLKSAIKSIFGKRLIELHEQASRLSHFLTYAPENSSLRTFQSEGQILPLGIKGEGLFAHLKALSAPAHQERLARIQEQLELIDWFEGFEIPNDLAYGERRIRIRDRFLAEGAFFDQRSANEGFLFLLFYITLLVSPDTPTFFAIDNIDSSLNPKLCQALVKQIAILAEQHQKQVILTTHNPAVLDGLNLHDDQQRLFVVDRNKEGHTRVRRVDPPKPAQGQQAVSLSEAFMRGFIGGLPKNF